MFQLTLHVYMFVCVLLMVEASSVSTIRLFVVMRNFKRNGAHLQVNLSRKLTMGLSVVLECSHVLHYLTVRLALFIDSEIVIGKSF